MKNRNRLQPTFSTKTDTSYPTNVHPETIHNQADKKRTKMKISKSFVHTYKPKLRLAEPQKSKRTQKRKTPFLCTFLKGAKTDVFTSKTQRN